jgi:hypothetical protein
MKFLMNVFEEVPFSIMHKSIFSSLKKVREFLPFGILISRFICVFSEESWSFSNKLANTHFDIIDGAFKVYFVVQTFVRATQSFQEACCIFPDNFKGWWNAAGTEGPERTISDSK